MNLKTVCKFIDQYVYEFIDLHKEIPDKDFKWKTAFAVSVYRMRNISAILMQMLRMIWHI